MKVLQINTVYGYGSTGRIAKGICGVCREKNIVCKTGCRYIEGQIEQDEAVAAGSWWDCHVHNRLARITGLIGCFSSWKTRSFLRKVNRFAPDVIHLHNLHGNYINLRLLFRYIKKRRIPVIWTLHDCWAFTGYCVHFMMAKCEKWRQGCTNCPQCANALQKRTDIARMMWMQKRKWFTGVDNLTIVTPSQWLADLAKESYLGEYPVQVIHNGIDLNVFKPTEGSFRKAYGIEDKKVVLGVAFGWGKSKGLDVFIELSKRLDARFRIVLVGTNDAIDQMLPEGIISIHRTNDQRELVDIYSAADVFVNPTREENYPTVNMEALACGTPVITFRTGGSPEILDERCGSVIENENVSALEKEIIRMCEEEAEIRQACLSRAQRFKQEERFDEYVRLYESVRRMK